MNETKKTKQDISQDETSSAGEIGITSEPKAKTYTESEIQKAVSDALAKAGRDAKSLEAKAAQLKADQEAIEAQKSQIAEIQRQIDEAELEAARGDPVRLREIQAKKSVKTQLAEIEKQKAELRKQQAEIDRSKAEHESEVRAVRETNKEITIWQIATAKGVDPMRLKTLSEKFNIEEKEKLEELAGEIASGKPQDESPKKKITPDSLVTSGNRQSQEGKTARQIYAESFRDRK